VQLGWGRRARRIQGAVTWNTSHIAVQIARDPTLAKSLLREAGLPVPAGAQASGPREAVEIFHRLGAPVVVKALAAGIAEDAAAGLASDDAVRAAYERARRRGAGVVVERELAGADHRALVVDGRLVAVAWLAPPCVTGDGFRTVAGLLGAENQVRGEARAMAIPADAAAQEMLARQGLALESVPPAGMRVKLRAVPDLAAGATVEDVTAAVHPAVAQACERAARAIGLDVAGVLLACESVSAPLEAQGGGVVGITAAPDICMHERAGACGVSDSVLRTLLPGSGDGRIPLVAVAGGGAAVPRVIAQAFQASGLRSGASANALAVLASPEVEAAVLQLSPEALAARLVFDRCDVAVMVDPSIALSPGAMALAASARALVLDAEDPRSAALVRVAARGVPIVYVRAGGSGLPPRDIQPRAPCVYWQGETMMLAGAERRIPLIERHHMAPALGIEEALAAAAALWACGFEEGAIAAALGPRAARAPQSRIMPFDDALSEASHSHAHR